MTNIAIYTLTSALHDAASITIETQSFLNSILEQYDFRQDDYSDYGSHSLDLIYVRTGGTEGLFLSLLPKLKSQSKRPFYLLTSGKHNSLAASMEILSYLRQNGMKGEIIHGSQEYVAKRIKLLERIGEARQQLQKCRLGIVGKPSDWLISSTANRQAVKEKLGIDLIDVEMQALLDIIAKTPEPNVTFDCPANGQVGMSLPCAEKINQALHTLVHDHSLNGFTIRCFDLLSAVHNTGCLALAKLNAEGIIAGCEGDVPAMLSMMIAQSLTGCTGFQANPASINCDTGEITLAHCTIPLNMVKRYELDTHFESGIGVAIRGYIDPSPITIFKVSGDMSRIFVEEGELLRCEAKPNMCRTQMVIRLSSKESARYFLTNPIGNHHIVIPGHCKEIIEELCK